MTQNNWSNRALIPSPDWDKETKNKEWGVLAASPTKGQKRRGQPSLWILFTVTTVLPRSVRAQTPPVVPAPHSAAVMIFTHLLRHTTHTSKVLFTATLKQQSLKSPTSNNAKWMSFFASRSVVRRHEISHIKPPYVPYVLSQVTKNSHNNTVFSANFQ